MRIPPWAPHRRPRLHLFHSHLRFRIEYPDHLHRLIAAQELRSPHDDLVASLELAVDGDPVAIRDTRLDRDAFSAVLGIDAIHVEAIGADDQRIAVHRELALRLTQR